MDNRPIGVFDSGVGGLSVVRELRQVLPNEDIIYFADQANCPYGSRTVEEIQSLAIGVTRRLLADGTKLVVVACNTASTTSLTALRERFDVPFVGVVPALKPASRETRTGVVGVLATEATLASAAFESLVQTHAVGARVLRRACPDLVTLVEKSVLDGPDLVARIRGYLEPLRKANADQLVLGCTHFEFLRREMEEIAGADVRVLGSARPVAEQVARLLQERDLRSASGCGSLRLTTSGDPARFLPLAHRLLGAGPGTTLADSSSHSVGERGA